MNTKRIQIEDTTILLEDYELNKGKIIITNSSRSLSYYWGAMSGDLSSFLLNIDSDYFAGCLVPHGLERVLDVKRTFSESEDS